MTKQQQNQPKLLSQEVFLNQLKIMTVTAEFKNTIQYIIGELTNVQALNSNIIGFLSLLFDNKKDLGKISYTKEEIQEILKTGSNIRIKIDNDGVEVWMEEENKPTPLKLV